MRPQLPAAMHRKFSLLQRKDDDLDRSGTCAGKTRDNQNRTLGSGEISRWRCRERCRKVRPGGTKPVDGREWRWKSGFTASEKECPCVVSRRRRKTREFFLLGGKIRGTAEEYLRRRATSRECPYSFSPFLNVIARARRISRRTDSAVRELRIASIDGALNPLPNTKWIHFQSDEHS